MAAYLERHQARDAQGRALVVRNGKARARKVTCGAGTLTVAAPRVDDRRVDAQGQRQRFTSRILPPYMRRSPKVAEVLPVLYLRGLSMGDFQEALPILLGKDAAGLSPTNIARLTAVWEEEYHAFRQRNLAERDYVYVWVDGVHFTIRLEDERLCTLVMLGVRPDGTKELIAVEDGYRESTESWRTLLRDLKRRGMQAPVAAVGDGPRLARGLLEMAQREVVGVRVARPRSGLGPHAGALAHVPGRPLHRPFLEHDLFGDPVLEVHVGVVHAAAEGGAEQPLEERWRDVEAVGKEALRTWLRELAHRSSLHADPCSGLQS